MNTKPPSPLLGEVGVIALVPDRWGPCWQARQQIATRLARFFHVVWIDYPPTWRESLRCLFRQKKNWGSQSTPSGFHVYSTAPWFPHLGRPAWLRRWLSRTRLQKAHSMLRDRGCSRIVLYLWRPEFSESLDLLEHQLSCYHIDDEYSFSTLERELHPAELELIRKVDQVFVHSPAMMQKKGTLNPNTELVPNGVDYKQYTASSPEPAELQDIPKPRIGYSGNLKRTLNWGLLLQLARMHPEWSFVFLGRMVPHPEVQEIREELSRQPNIYTLGSCPTDVVPRFLQHFDVGIMPYNLDDYTKYIYPLKLHEYLASGKPVVGSPIPALQPFKDVVILARGPEEWSRGLTRALSPQENSIERRSSRQQVAAQYDWDVLVEKLARTLAYRLGLEFPAQTERVPEKLNDAEHTSERLAHLNHQTTKLYASLSQFLMDFTGLGIHRDSPNRCD